MLEINGIVPFTSIDYPGGLSAVLFCQGCPWHCRYCHNPHLQPYSKSQILWEDVMAFLTSRKGWLDAVVLSGGEATAQQKLPRAIQAIRSLGFKVGLHTAGSYPTFLKAILPFLDWVGMDIKGPLLSYDRITQVSNSHRSVRTSIASILESRVPCEFRTTVHPKLFSLSDLENLAIELSSLGVENYVLQSFRPQGCVDVELVQEPYWFAFDEAWVQNMRLLFKNFSIR